MATIAFSQAGPSRLALSIPSAIASWRNTFLAHSSSSSTVPSSEITSPSLLDSALQGLLELFPPFLLAVPKHKVTHSRKSMRSANKGLKNKSNISNCPACGAPKLLHHTCPVCFSQINRRWKEEARAAAAAGKGGPVVPESTIRHET